MKRTIALLSLLLEVNGCAHRAPVTAEAPQHLFRESVTLYERPLEIRLSKPARSVVDNVLIVYATGDGGWRGLDQELFEKIVSWNYPTAGFSSKSYLKNLGYVSDTTTPGRLVRDYRRIIDCAEARLKMPPETKIILVGLSRGAGLSVVAGGQGELRSHLAGLVAVALTKEEEHVVHRRPGIQGKPAESEMVEIKTYQYLPRLAEIPVTVIQSTNDGYLPSDDARALFGPDTELKRFRAVSANNHSFSGGRETLYKEAEASLAWIRNLLSHPPHGSTHGSVNDATSAQP